MEDSGNNEKNIVSSSSSTGNSEIDHQNIMKFVESLILDMQYKFQNMSDQIIGQIDEMKDRMDDLERNLNQMMENAGTVNTQNQNICQSTSKE